MRVRDHGYGKIVHHAVGNYTADEPRYMRHVQVMATLDYPQLVK
jgi:hypothetical protein